MRWSALARLLGCLLLIVVAVPAAAVQRAQVTCLAPPAGSGDAPTEYRIEREAAAEWTQIHVLPAAGPLVFVDRTAAAGTPYRYRCIAANAAGPGPNLTVSQSITLIGVPGQAGITVIIITE